MPVLYKNRPTSDFLLAMARFLLGDELGHIKSLRYAPDASQDKTSLKVIHDATQASAAVQKLAISSPQNESTIVRIFAYHSQLNVASPMTRK
jgi:hypothetical protein